MPKKKLHQQNNGAQQLASEATVYIQLEDVNDEIPLFTEREQETVLEGEPIGTKVTQVNAIDKDGTFPNNQVYYYIVDSPRNEGKDFFEINLQSGEIFTKVIFDREKQGAYALEVEARDGAPSARPNSNQQPNSGKQLKRWQGVAFSSRISRNLTVKAFPPSIVKAAAVETASLSSFQTGLNPNKPNRVSHPQPNVQDLKL
ncbi:hypothetical protein pipiens_001719 [Culex pipiens pipiens]|uniref:Cadherin domain-containing protein n=1 Tax=Culex pipiens pipiens TaxID=38569 RepID=A0ABD1E1V6_CULPP